MNSLLNRLTETITVKRTTSHTDAGDPVRATTFTTRARVERGKVEQGEADGRAIDNTNRVFTDVEILQGDLLFFAEDSTSTDDAGKRVISVTASRRLTGEAFMWTVLA